jgi:DNA-binding Xre family transcriptional regulator|tara:strand:- start:124 stop:339 length:216 start_codon:yes stop_codon:yes gene_type:complete
MNEKLKRIIGYAMYENDLTKLELSEYMEMSYPTMLNKLKNPGTLKISEAEKLCVILNIKLSEFLTNNNTDE